MYTQSCQFVLPVFAETQSCQCVHVQSIKHVHATRRHERPPQKPLPKTPKERQGREVTEVFCSHVVHGGVGVVFMGQNHVLGGFVSHVT